MRPPGPTPSAPASNRPLSSSPDEVARLMEAYLDTLAAAHATAAVRLGHTVTRTLLIAGLRLRLIIAGAHLAALTLPALAHLPDAETGLIDGEFLLWDEAASGVALPSSPWRETPLIPGITLALPPGAEAYRFCPSPENDTFLFINRVSGRAALWVRDARRLPFYQLASPLLLPIHWWTSSRGLRAIHAGCVATTTGAALIAGPSGAGKSTTSLLCAVSGLDYLSDDYCLVRPGPQATAYSLFNNAKLHRDQFARFPALAPLAVQPPPGSPDKPIVFFHQHHPERVRLSAPLRVVILPVVSGRETTTASRIPALAALSTLASSSIAQLPQDSAAPLLLELASLAHRLPCYRLDLGTRLDEIAPCVRSLITASA